MIFNVETHQHKKRTWSQQEADYEIEKLEQIEKVLEDIESLPNDITDKVNKIAETTPLQKEGNRKYHVLNLHDPHHIVNIEIQGDRNNLNEDYHHWDVRFKKDPEITFNKENIKKAFHFDDISDELLDKIENDVKESYKINYDISSDYYGDRMTVYWEYNNKQPHNEEILLGYLQEKYDPDLEMIWDMYE